MFRCSLSFDLEPSNRHGHSLSRTSADESTLGLNAVVSAQRRRRSLARGFALYALTYHYFKGDGFDLIVHAQFLFYAGVSCTCRRERPPYRVCLVAWPNLDPKTRWPHIAQCSQINFEKYTTTNAISLPGLYIGKKCTTHASRQARLSSLAPPDGQGFHFIGHIGPGMRVGAWTRSQRSSPYPITHTPMR